MSLHGDPHIQIMGWRTEMLCPPILCIMCGSFSRTEGTHGAQGTGGCPTHWKLQCMSCGCKWMQPVKRRHLYYWTGIETHADDAIGLTAQWATW
jgi:hypothetical protein